MSLSFDFDRVLEFKRVVQAELGLYLHMHDRCGGQYFEFDDPQPEDVWQQVEAIFSGFGYTITINPDNKIFWVE